MIDEFPMRDFVVQKGKYTGHQDFERMLPLCAPEQDLAVLTMSLAPYGIIENHGHHRVRYIGAYALDRLFARLGGEKHYDPKVGIWLHRLPGEVIKDALQEPFISVFFHPSSCGADEIVGLLRSFLQEEVYME